MGILGSTTGLLSLVLPQRSPRQVRQRFGNSLEGAAPSPDSLQDLVRRLMAYLDGHRVTFPDRLDLSRATAFQREVWGVARLIPYGETRSYGWVAAQIKRPGAARAVGQALARNPLPIIIPCHRVLASNGNLGGYSGGLEMKRHLLALEAANRA